MIQNVAPAFFLIAEHDIFQLQREISRHSLVLQIHVLPLCHSIALQDACLDEALAQTNIDDSYEYYQKAQWDGSEGIAPQGAATWAWIANVDHLYFTREGLYIAPQKPHPHGHGWSLVNNVDQWDWS